MRPSATLYILNFILFIFLLFPYLSVYKGNKGILRQERFHQKQILSYCIALLLLSVFGFSDFDFWGCWKGYIHCKKNGDSGVYEPFYEWLTYYTPNYFIWRTIIWGLAVFLMIKTIKRLKVNYNATFIFLTLIYVLSFYKLRNVLGFSVMFWGLSLIISPDKKNRRLCIMSGILYIVLSFWCHKTMIMSIALLASCCLKFNKCRINILIIAWPFLISAVTILLNKFIGGIIVLGNNDMGLANRAMSYATNVGETSNLNGMIRTALIESSILIPFAYMTKKIIYDKIQIPSSINCLYKYWFVTTYIAYLFAFQDAANWIYIRIGTMGYFPMCIVLGWYWATHRRTRSQRLILLLCLLSYLYRTCYMVYKMDLINRFTIDF